MVRYFRIVALALFVLAGYHTAYAGLIGATVDVAAYYPNTSSIYQDGGQKVVSGSIEYLAGAFSSYNSAWQVDVTDSQLIVTKTAGNGFPFAGADFNGFVLTIISGPSLTSASVDAASAFSPVGITISGNQLFLNYQGVTGDNASELSSIININSDNPGGVPEPATWVTLAAGLAGVGLLRARRKA
jgi:hypothetical protein